MSGWKRFGWCVLLAVLAVGLGVWDVDARSFRVAQVPNANKFGCNTCHTSGGGTPRNPFGLEVQTNFLVNGNVNWGPALAALDSDNDGFTNGQELGDPNGTGTPNPSATATHPGDPDSKPQQQPPGPQSSDDPFVESVTLAGKVLLPGANPPVPAGPQPFEVALKVPLVPALNEAGDPIVEGNIPVFRNFYIVPVPNLFKQASDIVVSPDGKMLTATVDLAANTTYQTVAVSAPLTENERVREYYVGTTELSDATISGGVMLPPDFAAEDIVPDLLQVLLLNQSPLAFLTSAGGTKPTALQDGNGGIGAIDQ